MRVSILHYAGPPVVGGVESTIYHHARLLTGAGFHVQVIAGRGEPFHPHVPFHSLPEVDSRHPEVLEVGAALARGEVPPAFYTLRDRLVGRLRPLLAESDACIVHNAITLHKNLPLTGALHTLAEEGATRLIAWCHDFAWQDVLYTPDLHPGYPWDLLRTPWPGVRYVVVSADRRGKLAALLDIPEAEIRVVYPGVDVDAFLKLEPETRRLVGELDLLSADPLMLLPARITRRKNIEFAIRVTAALIPHKPRATLLVTGPPGPHNPKNVAYLQSLRDLREELGVTDRVHFLYEHGPGGEPLHVTDGMMADLYRLSDLLLFPSRREGFGIPVLEAGLVRLPIFAADIPPVQESAGPFAHRFDPESDPEAVARAIADHLASDAAYRMRRRVLDRFTWQAILRRDLIPLLNEVMEDAPSGR
ncbi:MAG TPA: glycosyltransferase family 4 protein [Thermoflexia bacterium]|jgi:glycosyltransferase involved in cell wall biosynthesis|nr:glycosyltransferase family 4 protein [Thermoflexia bacterium]